MSVFDDTFNEQFFDTDVFSVEDTYTPEGGSASTFLVNFFNEGREIPAGNGITILKEPCLQARTDDISSPKRNETHEINGTTYYTLRWIPDGEGMWLIFLSENSLS